MTHSRYTTASSADTGSPPSPRARGKIQLPAGNTTGRARRARVEPMAVRPLRDDRYVVETEGGTYVVDVETDTCTCPDHAIRGARCKHVRRVAIEIDEGLVPPPGHRTATCAVCGRQLLVPTWERPPVLCATHDHRPGDLVADRETGKRLVVVDATGRRADEVTTDEGRPIADYETNEAYGDHEPVFEAVYLQSLGPVVDLGDVADAKRYGFPASRLRPLGGRRVPDPAPGTTDQRATS